MKDTRKQDAGRLDRMVEKYGILEVIRMVASVAGDMAKLTSSGETGVQDGNDVKFYQGYTEDEWIEIERLIDWIALEIESEVMGVGDRDREERPRPRRRPHKNPIYAEELGQIDAAIERLAEASRKFLGAREVKPFDKPDGK